MEDIRAEQQEEDTALNSSFASEEGDEMPPTPAKEPTAAAIQRSSIYTSDVDNSDLFTATHGVLHVIDSTGKQQPIHIWLGDIKLWTMAVEHVRMKYGCDTFEFTPFSSAQNWDKIHPELKIVGSIQPKSTMIMKNNPKESGNVDVGYTYIWMRLTKAINFLSNVLLFFFIVMMLMTGILHYVVNTYGPNYYAFDGSLNKDDYLDMCPTLSAHTLKDLIVDASMTPLETKSQTEKHGAAIVEDILTKETATQLREWTLKANQVLESTFVINNENRYHITPSHKEPEVQAALKEIASHPTFRPLLDSVMGPSSSLVSMSIITNLYGAEAQFFHPDTSGSSATHPDHFVSEYTLAIPLQDTTRDMGATTICPGTHKCSGLESSEDHYHKFMQEVYPDYDDEDYPILLDDEEFKEWLEYNYCDVSAELSAGSGLLYNTDLIHRGGGHVDPDAPERSVLFITFAESRKGKDDDRVFPVGTVHCLSYDR